MGSHTKPTNRMLVSLLLPALVLVVQAQDPPTAVDNQAAASPASVSSDLSQERRERLRNLFARRREQRVKPGDLGKEGKVQEEKKSVRTRIVRPPIRKEEPEEGGEERVITSVSVSSSVSTSSKITKRVKTASTAPTK